MTRQRQVHQCECHTCRAGSDPETARYHCQINVFLSRLNEPQRRWYVGLLSQRPDSPSDRQLAKITGLDEKTIRRGRRELETGLADLPPDRQRREGGGRPRAEKKTRN
jgi:hypothetical protein